MGARFKPSYRGLGELLNSEPMVGAMGGFAGAIMDRAQRGSPVGDPAKDPHAGRYAASFRVETGTHGGYEHDRAYGRVLNDAPEAPWVEFGAKNSPRYRVLGNAAGTVSTR